MAALDLASVAIDADLSRSVQDAVSLLCGGGLQAAGSAPGDVGSLCPSLTLNLSRFVDGCAATILKYAAPTGTCSVQVKVGDVGVHALAVTPTYQGPQVGSDAVSSSGLGLLERGTALGGHLTVSGSETAWLVEVRVPARDVVLVDP